MPVEDSSLSQAEETSSTPPSGVEHDAPPPPPKGDPIPPFIDLLDDDAGYVKPPF